MHRALDGIQQQESGTNMARVSVINQSEDESAKVYVTRLTVDGMPMGPRVELEKNHEIILDVDENTKLTIEDR